MAAAAVGALAGAKYGAIIGGSVTSETGAWGALPGGIGGAVVGGIAGYLGWWEGSYGFEWQIAEVGVKKAFADCMRNCLGCDDQTRVNDMWDNYWIKGN